MAVAVVLADADGRQPGPQDDQERAARGGGTAVMSHLQQVPACTVARDGREDVLVVIVLQVAGEQDALPADGGCEHDGGPVDGAAVREHAIG
jgi:hypothetical protein